VFWSFGGSGDEGQVNFRLGNARKFNFGFFCRFRETLQGLFILTEIYSFNFFEFSG
jgi:hypothetical protein